MNNVNHNYREAAQFQKLVCRLLASGWNMSCPEWKDKNGYLWERRSQRGAVSRIRIRWNLSLEKR